MKRILITGKNSYVGNSFEKWVENYPGKYHVDKISLRDGAWMEQDFAGYDSVLHVAGIAHMKETKNKENLYYQINRDLAYEVAEKAKDEGVSHFIFLSSMSVYGMDTGVIDQDTVPNPKSKYGKSKLQAEELINSLNDESFKVATLRPPMIYGKGCKGNYPRLANLALKTPVFPDVENRRSMIYVDNLSEFIRKIADKNKGGIYYPQNQEYVCTSELVNLIAQSHKKRIYLTVLMNPLINLFKMNIVKKVFGNLIYDQNLSQDKEIEYRLINFKESVEATEAKREDGIDSK